MSKLPIFYSSISILNREKDRALKVLDGGRSVTFSRGAHLVPALAEEFPAASRELPIVFVMSDNQPSPVFVVGVELAKNAFVTEDGKWNAQYIPAYLRRYPFIQGNIEGQTSVICVDGGYQQPEEGGEALFTEAGENTPYLDSAIQFVENYAQAALRTEAFVNALREHDLLKEITVEVRGANAGNVVLQGFLAVNEQKLAELSDEAFLALRKSGALPAIYAHLLSLSAFSNLREKASTPVSAAKADA